MGKALRERRIEICKNRVGVSTRENRGAERSVGEHRGSKGSNKRARESIKRVQESQRFSSSLLGGGTSTTGLPNLAKPQYSVYSWRMFLMRLLYLNQHCLARASLLEFF